jgi:hypothetical protein
MAPPQAAHRRLSMNALSAQGNLSEARPAPNAYNLYGERNPGPVAALIVLTTTAPSRRVQSDLLIPTGWVGQSP